MAKILLALVPLSGHVNPAVPMAKQLVADGHEVRWYCGKKYRESIEAAGVQFYPYVHARDFHDSTIKSEFPLLPENSLFRHATYYIKHVFYDNMPGQYQDLCEILKEFNADVLVTDEWFTGGIPFAERKQLPWVVYCNSPLFFYDNEVPFPGAGIFPADTNFGIHRNRIVNWMASNIIFAGTQRYINKLRNQLGLPAMKHLFLLNNLFISDLFIKFNTKAFEFNWKELPAQVRFVGPVLPELPASFDFDWLPRLKSGKPVIFITQGSVNIDNFDKLIIPSLKALSAMDVIIVIAAGKESTEGIRNGFTETNIIIEKFIPYDLVMPYASLMITNGGFGGVITALWHGVPLVVAGDSEDKPEIASRVEYCKVGIDLGTGYPSPKKIRQAVEKVFADPQYKNNAMMVSRDFLTHNAPVETAYLIKEIIAANRR